MATSSSSSLLILAIACCFVSAISQQTCKSQNLSSTAPFDNCLDLPSLRSYLHYTYDASNSSLSVAFVATPSASNGWVAWAINPTGTKMAGSQAFLAYRPRAGAAPTVKTYNISGYALDETATRLSFEHWNERAESMSDGRIAIFTTIKVRAGEDKLNQVWQIGGTVTNGVPGIHPRNQENLRSMSELSLTGDEPSSAPGSAPGPATGGSTTPGQPGAPGNGGSIPTNVNFGVNLGIMVLLGCILIL